jgi:hypothetical protein
MRITSVRPFLAFVSLSLLAGCGSVESLIPHYDFASSPLKDSDDRRQVAQAAANPAEKQVALPVASRDINCPEVDIAEGGSAYRAGGAESASVRYQFNISDTARQCDPAGPGQATIKIGVAGNLVIGPAGSPGTFSVPLRITVTQDSGHKQVYSRTYKIEATADAMSSGQFRMVAEPIPVSMPTLQLASIYSITVGFEGGGGGAAPRAHRHKTAG